MIIVFQKPYKNMTMYPGMNLEIQLGKGKAHQ